MIDQDFCWKGTITITEKGVTGFQHWNSSIFTEEWKSITCSEIFRDQLKIIKNFELFGLLIGQKSTSFNSKTIVLRLFSWISGYLWSIFYFLNPVLRKISAIQISIKFHFYENNASWHDSSINRFVEIVQICLLVRFHWGACSHM
jgi:hypothetical protein